jgi:pyrimidine deaminase RibD-like protein
MVDSPIEQKRAQRKALLRALYVSVEGREGFAITPMQYFAIGAQVGLQQDVTGQTVRFLASEGLLEYKPASESVALTHNGVVEVERQSNGLPADSREAQLGALPQRILSVLRHKRTKIQMEELKESLPDFSDVPDSDWYATINDLLSEGMIEARVVRSGIYDAVGAAYNIGMTQGGRTPTPNSSVESKKWREASSKTDDRKFARLAIEEARKSVPEDERIHPRVGVVVVKDGRVLATAHRGEFPQCHGEFIALEKKLPDVSLAGSTVYTTLEPCTSRNHPKVPCATRLAERKVARVVIGMLDPDDRISGRGQRALRKAGIATGLFDHDLMTEIEELNRDFIREKEATEARQPRNWNSQWRDLSSCQSATEAALRRTTLATQGWEWQTTGSSPDTTLRSTTFNLRMAQNWYSIVVTQND